MTLTVTIDSNDRTNYIIWKTFRKVDNINSKVDTCSFSTRKYGTSKNWSPSVGDEISVDQDGTTIFAGVIIKVTERVEGTRLQVFDVECKDWIHHLDKRLVAASYTDQKVEDIITNIISVYASEFTVTNVSCGITVDSIKFNYVSVSEALQMLAEQVNYSWYVDYNKDIHFFAKNVEMAPFELSDTLRNHIIDSLVVKDDISQLRNLVIIRGGEKEGNTRTEPFTGDGKKKIFALANKFSGTPTVMEAVNSTPYNVGIDYLNEDADYDCLWNYNEKYIRFTSCTPLSGSPIEVSGTPLVPIIVQVQDDASIATYGQYEFKKVDKTIKTTAEAVQYANAQLEAYKATIKEGSFETYTSGLRSGQVIVINSTIRSISNEKFLIQSVRLKMRGYNEGIWTVALATLRTIGIIDFLQRLISEGNKQIIVGENEVLEKYYSDYQDIEITESVEEHADIEEHQTIQITELIRDDPWTPSWVLGKYTPVDDDDPRRDMRLGTSSYLN